MSVPPALSTRPAQESDRGFAYEVKRAALGPYITQTWGWDEAFQQAFHAREWQAHGRDIVVLNGQDIGTVGFERDGEGYHMAEFYLLPEHHGRGTGSRLMRRMLARADAEGVPVRLEVLKVNPARSLYERHGFQVSGETDTHFRMVRAPGHGPS